MSKHAEQLRPELDPSRPIVMTAYPNAECKVLGTINSLFPLIVSVAFPGMYDVIYHVDPADGDGICYVDPSATGTISGFTRGVFHFVNKG